MYSKYSDDIYENKAYCIPCTKYVQGITNGLVVAKPPHPPRPPRPPRPRLRDNLKNPSIFYM